MKSLGISILSLLGLFVIWWAEGPRVVSAQTRKPFLITRLYTGQDGQTHAEEFEAKFTDKDVSMMMQVKGAELHRGKGGTVQDWHVGPRRQYVITLSGRAEIEVAGGKKIPV